MLSFRNEGCHPFVDTNSFGFGNSDGSTNIEDVPAFDYKSFDNASELINAVVATCKHVILHQQH